MSWIEFAAMLYSIGTIAGLLFVIGCIVIGFYFEVIKK